MAFLEQQQKYGDRKLFDTLFDMFDSSPELITKTSINENQAFLWTLERIKKLVLD